jgi:uncharacterized protein (TIGR02145 family)
MNFFIRKERALLIAMVAILAVLTVSCSKKGGGNESSSEKKSEHGSVSEEPGKLIDEEPGKLTDKRDGKTYKTVKIGYQIWIGGQTWMAENLNHETGNSWCYNNDDSSCKQYGRLYDWETAMEVCPAGWRLPSRVGWMVLTDVYGCFSNGELSLSDIIGKKLKSMSGWDKNGNGKDVFGFSALPGGSRAINGSFNNASNRGLWWTASEFDRDSAYYRRMGNNYDYVYEGNFGKGAGFSVRCVEGAALSCGGKKYDQEQYFCHKDKLVERCGFCLATGYNAGFSAGVEYDPETQFCALESENDGGCDSYGIFDKCGGKVYDQDYQFCHKNSVIDNCNANAYDMHPDGPGYRTGKYNPEKEFCHNDKLVAEKCGGKTYNAETQLCDGGKIKDYNCGGKKYNATERFCYEGNLYESCSGWGFKEYDPGTQRCENGFVEDK